MTLSAPTKSLTWCKNIGVETYMDARAGFLMEIYNETTSTLIERRWDKNGGVFGDNNHPVGSEKTIATNDIITVTIYHLGLNKLPMQVIIFNSDTTDTNDYSTFPTGIVNGVGSVGAGSTKLHKKLIGGEKVVMRFQATANTFNWWKINCNCLFEIGTTFTATNPNDGVDYSATFFQLDYYGGNIRWGNNEAFFPNATTWNTEISTDANPWYKVEGTQNPCSKLTNGLLLSTWNNAGDGVLTLLNQPFQTWDFGWGGYRVLKVIKFKPDGITPHWFEVRGKDAYKQFPYAVNIDGTETDCTNLLGANIGLSADTTVLDATGYMYDNGVFKTASSVCDTPTVGITANGNKKFVGENLTLTANGSNITHYQWYKNNAIIAGATSNLYVKNEATADDAGIYYCKVFNNCGGVSATAERNSETITVSVDFGIVVIIDGEILCQDHIGQPLEFGYSNIQDILSVAKWTTNKEVSVYAHGNYYFFARIVSEPTIFYRTELINTNLLK